MNEAVVGVLLAGGQARRMGGGDKCLRTLSGEPILAHVVRRVRPQVGPAILNAGGDPARFAGFGLPVVPDTVEGFAGPLAGILTGLEWAAEHAPGARWVASFATDAPFVPTDLVDRMVAAVASGEGELACASSGRRTHPVFGLWPVEIAGELRKALVEEDERKIDRFTARRRVAVVEYGAEPVDPFFNANRPEDLEQAERLLAAG